MIDIVATKIKKKKFVVAIATQYGVTIGSHTVAMKTQVTKSFSSFMSVQTVRRVPISPKASVHGSMLALHSQIIPPSSFDCLQKQTPNSFNYVDDTTRKRLKLLHLAETPTHFCLSIGKLNGGKAWK